MNEQNNPEEEEYEEEEIEVYEEVEVDEEQEASETTDTKKKNHEQNSEIIQNKEINSFSNNNPENKNIQIINNKEDLLSLNKNNQEIDHSINQNKDKENNKILNSNNDAINNIQPNNNLLLEEKITFDKNTIEDNKNNTNDNNNNINILINKENNDNIPNNINDNINIYNNNDNNDKINKKLDLNLIETNSNNNDFIFDFNNNFNFNNINDENKYLNLDYKIISNRDSLDFQNEVKNSNFIKKESNIISNSLNKDKDTDIYNNNNIQNININKENKINNNNISTYPQHRSKIRRNNKKPLNVNNYNTNNNYNNNDNININISNLNKPDFESTMKSININQDSYYKDNEMSNIYNINSGDLQLTDRVILSSLNVKQVPQSENKNRNIEKIHEKLNRDLTFKNIEIDQNFNNSCQMNDMIRYDSRINPETLSINFTPNRQEENNLYNPIVNNNSQIINIKNDYNTNNENRIKNDFNELNIIKKSINFDDTLNNNYGTNNNNNELIPLNNKEEDHNININTNMNGNQLDIEDKNKTKIIKKTKDEIQYENVILELFENNEIIDLLDSRKWEEKKQGFIKLNQCLTQNQKDNLINEHNFENVFMYIVYKLNNFKETNFNLLKEGILCLNNLFSFCKGKNFIPDKKYLEKIIFGLNEKIADSKLKEVYIQLLKSLIEIYSKKKVYDLLLEILLITNKITVLKEYSIFIIDNIKKSDSINDLDLKNLIDFSVKIANHTNPQIRSISIELICLLYKFIGPDLKQLISGIKESTYKIIEKELEKINFNEKEKFNNNESTIKDLIISTNKIKKNKNDSNLSNPIISPDNNGVNNNKRIDISKELTPKLLKEINRGKWIEKKEGIEYINSVLDKANNKISKNGLQDLFDLIKDKLNDGNQNLVKMILQLLAHLILALEGQIKTYYKNLVYPLLLKLSDKSKQIRDECLICVENWIKMQNFEIFAVYLPQLLISNENYEMRYEILNLLSKNKDLIKNNYQKVFFKELTKAFLICLQDKNATIRNMTEELIKDLSNFIPREKYVYELKDIKRSISDYLYNILDKILPKINQEISETPNDNKEKGKNDNLDKEENDLKNNDTNTLYHQQLLPNKKYIKKDIIKKKKKESNNSMDKTIMKANKKDNSIISDIKNKNFLNNTINSTILDKKKDGDKTDRTDRTNLNNKKKRNKVVSCDKVTSKKLKKNDKLKLSSLNLNTENNTSRNLNKIRNNNCNNNNTISTQDIKKTHKKARNRSMITEKNKNNENNDTKILTNYNTKKDPKSLTAEKTLKYKKKMNPPKINQNIKNIKIIKEEQPIKKLNPKKFINSNNKGNKNQIFLTNYKVKKGLKEKRYEKDKKNNFYFEIQNYDYLPKISELLKTIFTSEFISRLFSNDLKLINLALTQLKNLIDESLKKENDENFDKLINNLDLLLKVIGIKVSSNQTASLIKTFFIFADTLINSYKIKNYKFNDIEVNILLNTFADKLTNNNLILKETACNLIWFLNDQIDNSKTFTMLIHLLEYKNAKLKSEIIDIIIKLYDNSSFDINILCKVLKNIIRAYFDADFNTKKNVLYLLQDMYEKIGEDFWKHTKFLSSKDRDELHKNLAPENGNELKDTSREYEIDDLNSSNFGDDDSDNNEIINNDDKDHLNDNNNIFNFKDNNYDYDNEKNNVKINNKINMEKQNKKHIFKRSITDNSKKESKKDNSEINTNNYKTNIITSNLTDISNINDNNNDDSKSITEKELKEALDMLLNPDEDPVEAIINIHYITFRNYIQNKKLINSNADNIINCFIKVINKLFSNKPIRIKIIKYYIVILCKLCNIQEFIINISINSLKDLIILILSSLLIDNLNNLGDNDEGMTIWKSLNSIISHIIEYCHPTNVISIIIELEQKFRKEKPKLAEYSARCLVIMTQNIKKIYKIIDLKVIFNNIYLILEDFIKENNDLQLKEKTDQTIIITLRNLINELVKAKMDTIIKDYNNWLKANNINEEQFILNWINESISKINKQKNIEDEVINNNNNHNNVNLKKNENGQILDQNKNTSLDDIKKKWKELKEKNNK